MTGTSCLCKGCGCPRLAEDASGICWLCRQGAHYIPLPRVAAAAIDHSGTRIAHRLGRPPEEYGYCRRACERCPGFRTLCVGYPARFPVETWPEVPA
jgi:hypothetical protein